MRRRITAQSDFQYRRAGGENQIRRRHGIVGFGMHIMGMNPPDAKGRTGGALAGARPIDRARAISRNHKGRPHVRHRPTRLCPRLRSRATGRASRSRSSAPFMRNPLELWGEPSFRLEWMKTKFFNERTLIANHPGLVRHVLVDNAKNYRMATIRQLILRPILREWPADRRGRDLAALAQGGWRPVFTPRHAQGFAAQMAGAVPCLHHQVRNRSGTRRDPRHCHRP